MTSMLSRLSRFSVKRVLTAFETSTSGGRSRERYRRITLTAISSGAARAISLLTMLVSVRLIVNHFGAERYALWATITSTVTLLVFADFGISNGLLNAISESHGRDDRKAALSQVSTGFFGLLAAAVFAAFSLGFSYRFVPWSRIFNLTSPVAMREAGPAAAVFILCFLAQLPLGVVQRVQMGYQEGFFTQIWIAAGNLLGLIGLLVVIRYHAGLPYVVLAVAGAPVVTGLLNTITVFGWQRPWLKPRLSSISRAAAGRLLRLGFLFFLMQIAGAVSYQTDNLIIAQLRGATQVTQYAVPFRLFAVIPAVISMGVASLWPAYAEACSRGDVKWVKTTLRCSLLLGLAVAIPANLLLIALGRRIIRLWVGPEIVPSVRLLVGLAIWAILISICGPLGVFLNGIGFIRMQAICGVLMAASNVPLSIYLTHRIGISGVIYGSILSTILFTLIPYSFCVPRLLSKMPLNQPSIPIPIPEVQVRLRENVVG
jgi:O-antigen/teichoic acid export membrane protein